MCLLSDVDIINFVLVKVIIIKVFKNILKLKLKLDKILFYFILMFFVGI